MVARSKLTGGGCDGVGTRMGGAAVQDDEGDGVHTGKCLKWVLGFVECNMVRDIESVCREI